MDTRASKGLNAALDRAAVGTMNGSVGDLHYWPLKPKPNERHRSKATLKLSETKWIMVPPEDVILPGEIHPDPEEGKHLPWCEQHNCKGCFVAYKPIRGGR